MPSLLRFQNGLAILALGILPIAAGCSQPPVNLGYVSGVITVDGEPLDKATISFRPKEGGRPSFGLTDSNGYYTVYHTSKFQGAELGEHEIKIDLMPDSSYYAKETLKPKMGPMLGDGSGVRLPSDMASRQVEAGSQVYDFALTKSQLPKR
ncbi:carboxypeptidase regulatory-like domain-containing protein [Bremerella cremea]|uniref:Carboxypeptidase regulatory-like domain-containing protein n=1 Tax=Bremerella cremea TaxID=1031537 RepID=A0A368KSJ3_9BACT|nr:carboxypeptidase regulatory-like domain-containing protein [Bremerella cremea]RCS48305.1 carboxypeptidase regulatory-like domain-containing protein [Bremerella cremea]